MKIAIIDPSKFSYPYDYCLMSSLVENGEDILYYTSRFRHGQEMEPRNYVEKNYFYRITYRLEKQLKSGVMYRVFKALEHILCMLFLPFKLKRDGVKIVHFQWCPIVVIDYFSINLMKLMGLSVFYTAHNFLPHGCKSDKFGVYKKLYKVFDAIFVHSEDTKKNIRNILQNNTGKVTVIKHGNFNYLNKLECTELSMREVALAEFLNNHSNATKLLCFGLIREYKGLHHAIDILSDLNSSDKKYVLCVVGKFIDNKYRNHIKELIAKKRLTDYIFITDEFVSDKNIALIVGKCDIALFPYEAIDQSGALLAILSIGMPIVATNHPGFRSIVKCDQNGELVNLTCLRSGFVDAIKRITPELIAQYSSKSKEIASNDFGWREIATKTSQIYRQFSKTVNADD